MTTRTNKGGSIVTFIIIGVLLLAGLGAGVYYLSNDSSFVRQAEDVATETADKAEDAVDEVTPPTEEQAEEQDPDATETKPEEEEPAQAPDAPVQNDTDDAPDTAAPVTRSNPTDGDDNGTDASTSPDELAITGRQAPAEMPQTGATENFLGVIGFAVLSFTIMAYIRSMRTSVVE